MQIDAIRTNDKNPRTISQTALDKLKASIQRDPDFMALRPIVVDRDGVIIGGNQRYRACRELGMTELPDAWVVKAATLTEAQRKRFIAVDNSPDGISGDWDWEALQAGWTLPELDEVGLELPDDLKADVGDPVDAEPQVDRAEELREQWGVKPGDLWALGDHRLMCGDSLKRNPFERCDLCFTDPPFEMNASDVVKVCFSVSDAAVVCGYGPQYASIAAQEKCKYWFEIVSIRTMPRSLPQYTGPFILHWGNACITNGGKHPFHRDLADGRFGSGSYYPSIRGPYKCGENDHGHSKPVEWAAELISMCCAETIADPFSGSGTTIIACEQLHRKCRAIEISPGYVAVALQRWADATGKTPSKLP